MVQWQYLFLQPTSLQTRFGGCSLVIWLWLIRKITLDNSTSMKKTTVELNFKGYCIEASNVLHAFLSSPSSTIQRDVMAGNMPPKNVVARCPHLPLAIRQELSHAGKSLVVKMPILKCCEFHLFLSLRAQCIRRLGYCCSCMFLHLRGGWWWKPHWGFVLEACLFLPPRSRQGKAPVIAWLLGLVFFGLIWF